MPFKEIIFMLDFTGVQFSYLEGEFVSQFTVQLLKKHLPIISQVFNIVFRWDIIANSNGTLFE